MELMEFIWDFAIVAYALWTESKFHHFSIFNFSHLNETSKIYVDTHWCISLHMPLQWIYQASMWLSSNGTRWRKQSHHCHKGTDPET